MNLHFHRLARLVLVLASSASLHAVPRMGTVIAKSGDAIPGVAGVTALDFFQFCTNANGDAAFLASCSDSKQRLLVKAGANPLSVVYAVGDTPNSAPAAVKSITQICLQDSGTCNSAVVHSTDRLGILSGNTSAYYASALSGSEDIKTAVAALNQGTSLVVGTTTASKAFSAVLPAAPTTVALSSMNGSYAYAAPNGMHALMTKSPTAGLTRSSSTVVKKTYTTRYDATMGLAALTGHTYIVSRADFVNKYGLFMGLLPSGYIEIARAGTAFGSATIQDTMKASLAVNPWERLEVDDSGNLLFTVQLSTGKKALARYIANTAGKQILVTEGNNLPGLNHLTISAIENFAVAPNGSAVVQVATISSLASPPKIGSALLKILPNVGGSDILARSYDDTISVGGVEKTISGFLLQNFLPTTKVLSTTISNGISTGPRVTVGNKVAAYVKTGNDRVLYLFDL